jgi:hypothetical protein
MAEVEHLMLVLLPDVNVEEGDRREALATLK